MNTPQDPYKRRLFKAAALIGAGSALSACYGKPNGAPAPSPQNTEH